MMSEVFEFEYNALQEMLIVNHQEGFSYNMCYEDDVYSVTNKLNEQQATINKLKEENEQLKEERNYFERKKCEYFNKYNKKHLDNIQLKEENEQLRQTIQEVCELLAEANYLFSNDIYYLIPAIEKAIKLLKGGIDE